MFKIILVSTEVIDPLVNAIIQGIWRLTDPDCPTEIMTLRTGLINRYLDVILLEEEDDVVDSGICDGCKEVADRVTQVLTKRLDINLTCVSNITYHQRYGAVAFHMEIE